MTVDTPKHDASEKPVVCPPKTPEDRSMRLRGKRKPRRDTFAEAQADSWGLVPGDTLRYPDEK